MLQEYLPILIFLGIAAGVGMLLLGLGFLIGSGQKDDEKLSPYECGFEAFDDGKQIDTWEVMSWDALVSKVVQYRNGMGVEYFNFNKVDVNEMMVYFITTLHS